MKKDIIKLTESDLQNIIQKIIKEQNIEHGSNSIEFIDTKSIAETVKSKTPPIMETKTQKIIKIKQKELSNIIAKVIAEQSISEPVVPPYPIKNETGTPELKKRTTQTSDEIIQAKQMVNSGLKHALIGMEKLMGLTGLNPSNDISGDIQKAQDKFDSLFGIPKPDKEENEEI
jgi:hypothetical protein